MNVKMKKGETGYFKGDKIQFTGKEEVLYGGLFDEFVYLEGYKKAAKKA